MRPAPRGAGLIRFINNAFSYFSTYSHATAILTCGSTRWSDTVWRMSAVRTHG
jgi:hypothetical protein